VYTPCDPTNVPKAPVLSGSPLGSNFKLDWTAPTQYSDNETITTLDTIKYDLYKSPTGATYTAITGATDLTDLSYTDHTPGGYYKVVAKNSCPLSSDDSNIIKQCPSDCDGLSSSPATLTMIPVGTAAFTLSVSPAVCEYAGNGNTADKIVYKLMSTGQTSPLYVQVTELAGNAGTFSDVKVTTTTGTQTSSTLAGPTTSLTPSLKVAATDTIKASAIFKTSATDPSSEQCTEDLYYIGWCPCSISGSPSLSTPANFTETSISNWSLTWTRPSTATYCAQGGYEVQVRSKTSSFAAGDATPAWPADTTTFFTTTDPTKVSITQADKGNLTTGTYYQFRVRSKSNCTPTPQYSTWVTSVVNHK